MTRTRRSPVWWLLLGLTVLTFVTLSLPRYLTLDPARSRVTSEHVWHYPLLVTHVVCGSVAILTAVLQVWPWLRRTHPTIHRRVGRAYVFAGVWPAGAAALTIGVVSPFGGVTAVSDVVLGILWLTTTSLGYGAIRRRDVLAHRRWMIRSAALTFSIVINRIVAIPIGIVVFGAVERSYGGNERWATQITSGVTAWLSWTIALVASQLVLDRIERRRPPSAKRGSKGAVPTAAVR